MRTLAITNQKGGSGKTTTVVSLAGAFGELGKRVLVLDLDPQGSATGWLGVAARSEGRGLAELYEGRGTLHDLVRATAAPGVELVPASPWLVGADRPQAGRSKAEATLRRAFTALPCQWDLLLVDCPPSLGLLTVSALLACHEVLIPADTHVTALSGIAALLETVDRLREQLNPRLAVAGILACRLRRTNLARDVLARLRERFGDLVLQSVVRESVRLAEAPTARAPITDFDPRGAAAEDYRAVARELLAR